MGIILSALAAAGDQGIKSLDQEDAHRRQMERDERMADITTEKAKTLAQFNRNLDVQTANEQRSAASDRINAAQQGIIDSAINQKYAGSDAAVADANAGLTDAPLTPEQQSVIDQSKGQDRAHMLVDPSIRDQAAIQTGDIDPKTAATLHNKSDIQALKSDMYLQNIQARLESTNNRTEMMGAIAQARIEAAQANGGKDGKLPSDAKMIDYLVKNSGLSQQEATDRVMGTGAGATKDPVAMAASLASSLINSGTIRVPKDAPAGTTIASLAMEIATGQIKAAEDKFRPARAAAPGPAAAPAPAKRADPLGLFK